MSDERDDPKNWPDGAPWLNPMSDTRTDQEVIAHRLDIAVGGVLFNVNNFPERVQSRLLGQDMAPLRGKIVSAILGVIGDIRIPRQSTIAVPHTPEEIWEFADRECDAGFWDKEHLEYTPDGVLHLASNVNITADMEHLPVELRPEIGEDRVDA
jgi:hypothetical protein